jgi:hypothetical protein
VPGSIRLTAAQWALFKAIGGAEWLRDNLQQIQGARLK